MDIIIRQLSPVITTDNAPLSECVFVVLCKGILPGKRGSAASPAAKPNQVSPPVVVEAFLIAACQVQVSLSSMGAFSSGPERPKRKQHQQGREACRNHCMAKSNNIQFSEFIWDYCQNSAGIQSHFLTVSSCRLRSIYLMKTNQQSLCLCWLMEDTKLRTQQKIPADKGWRKRRVRTKMLSSFASELKKTCTLIVAALRNSTTEDFLSINYTCYCLFSKFWYPHIPHGWNNSTGVHCGEKCWGQRGEDTLAMIKHRRWGLQGRWSDLFQ